MKDILPWLPWELVLAVMISLLPPNPAQLIPASDQGTQLLLTCTRVSQDANRFAILKLRQHCIFLDSEDRLRRFLVCLEATRDPKRLDLPSVFDNIWAMYLAPFGSIMDNLPTAHWVRDVFGYTSDTLKRLVVDIPFGSLPPWNDHLNVGPVLHEGFEKLANLEEFVCTRDAVRLGYTDEWREDGGVRSVIYNWPKLRRLALNRPLCNVQFWECLADLHELRSVVLTPAMTIIHRDFDLKKVYLERTHSTLNVVLADLRAHKRDSDPAEPATSSDAPVEERLQLMLYKIPIPKRRNFLDTHSQWLMTTALEGELWDVEAEAEPLASAAELGVPIHS